MSDPADAWLLTSEGVVGRRVVLEHAQHAGPYAPMGGAYGFRICGVHHDCSQLVEAPAHWPPIELCVRVASTPPLATDYLDEHTATLPLRPGGSVVIDRAAGRATFSLPTPPRATALLHPHLAAVAAVASYWRGRDSFHAGAFVAGGGVWALLGDKGSGKSSTLASLVSAGIPVVCDDLLILDGNKALAGPRSIDLRRDAAQRLGAGQPLGVIGGRERWRLPLAPVEPELPLRGWVTLRWAQGTTVRSVRGSERLRELLRHRALRVGPPHPVSPIELCSLSFLELSRPCGWSSMAHSLARLLEAVSG